ncbi:lipopolysaccharide biosynthesis protein [Halomonas aquamarina]|uniref:Lipopolysaccharide biosynthesis protein n=2 Tax=Vreelandella aquamarina TaxID=77097 RepID=A0ACC5VR32_9GAMM|nr:lipopolysaccharide biosynthesis protein [Halomonas aquamarina]
MEDLTLVGFVVMVLRQWRLMLVFMLAIIMLTAGVVYLKPAKYNFTTVYSVASYETAEGIKRGLETPDEVIAKISNVFLEQTRRSLLSKESIEQLPFETMVTNPRNTLLLSITSKSSEKNQEMIERFQENLIDLIQQDQQAIVESLTNSLQYQFEAYSQALEAARDANTERASELEATYIEAVTQLERRIASINEGNSTQVAVRSLEPVGLSKQLLLAIGFFLAFLLAPLAAIFSLFVKKVIAEYRLG